MTAKLRQTMNTMTHDGEAKTDNEYHDAQLITFWWGRCVSIATSLGEKATHHSTITTLCTLTEMSRSSSMVFTCTCESINLLALMLRNLGFRSIPISGHMTQGKP